MEDTSQVLVGEDATFLKMDVETCLYLTRDRPDISFTVRDFAICMSNPTVSAMRHLKKLVSYLKRTSHYAVVLQWPHGGQGLHKQSNDRYWLLESFSGSDCTSAKDTDAPHVEVSICCVATLFPQARVHRGHFTFKL